MRGPPDAEDK
jgi:putative transposase